MSTYSWPDSCISSYMISSVIDRSTNRSPAIPSYRREVQRSAEPDARARSQLWNPLARGLNDVGVDHRARNHRHARFQRHAGDAGLAPVEPTVRGSRSFGVDAEQAALAKDANAGIQSRLGRVGVLAVDRHLAGPSEEHPREKRPFRPGVVKYSDLARNVTRRGTNTGMKNESQNDRWLLARIAGPSLGHVLDALGPRAPHDPQERTHSDVFQKTVEHGPPPLARPSHVTVPPQAQQRAPEMGR